MSQSQLSWRDGLLALADGSVFEGEVLGFDPGAPARPATGEVVFNTVMTGYQEVLTDPSYAGQLVAFTYPHIGNYGVAPDDEESREPFCRGLIVRELTDRPSNWRATEPLAAWLGRRRVRALAGVDTRRLTRQLRDAGAVPGAFGPVDGGPGSFDEAELIAAAAAEPPTEGRDLVAEVTCQSPYQYGPEQSGPNQSGPNQSDPNQSDPNQSDPNQSDTAPWQVVAYDFGIKRHILRQLGQVAAVTVVPAGTPAEDVLERRPDGVFLSNGPGDPAAVAGATEAVRALLGQVPLFGICLGHQLLAQALGASTYKLPFGHHGGNHPVRRLATGTVEITSQNHNYAVVPESFAVPVETSHVNLNDGVIEGFVCRDVPAFAVQYHPEAAPGPHDARYLFDQFAELMRRCGTNGAARGWHPAGEARSAGHIA